MEYRSLGRTGVKVSPLCLGAMMFGAWGNEDHDESVAVIHAALDAGINFIDTADVYSAGESEEIVAKALQGRRDDVVLATKFFAPMGSDPNMAGGSRRWIMRECENSLQRLQHRLHRPVPGAPTRSHRRHRRDPRRAHRPRAPGQGPVPRELDVPGVRRSSRRSGSPSGATASGSCASSRRIRSSCGGSRPTCCRRASATAWVSSRGARSPAAGCRASGAKAERPSPATGRAGSPRATTSTIPATGSSSTRPTRWHSSPTMPASPWCTWRSRG